MGISLAEHSLVDTPPEEGFDRFTRLATHVLGVPTALVSIVETERDRQYFTSACGLGEPWASQRQTPLSHSFCKHVKASGEPLCVEDAREHPLVRDNLAIRDLGVIAYLGIPIHAPDGEALGALCAIDSAPRKWSREDVDALTDVANAVTDQIRLKAALISSEASQRRTSRLGLIVENAQHEVFIADADTLKFLEVNTGARENLGYPQQDLLELTPADITTDFTLEEAHQLFQPIKCGDVSHIDLETTHIRRDGTTYPAKVHLEYHQDKEGGVLIAFCEDISERRAMEDALHEKSQDFAAVFDSHPDPMVISETDTRILMVNPAFEKVLGRSAHELIGRLHLEIAPPQYREGMSEGIASATPADPYFQILRTGYGGDGGALLWTSFVQFVDGKKSKVFSIGKDVTELHEAKLRAEQRELEAQKATEIRTMFLANMSHEVRTPLNAIIGLFQLIQMAKVPERQKKQAEVGLEASHQLLAQLVNVLEASRMEADAVEINSSLTAVRSLAEQWLETAAATKHRLGKTIELRLEIDEATPEFWHLDPRRVTQIINNLTDNALKFTEEGSVVVQVGMGPAVDDQDAPRLEIAVSDTGRGIPQTQQSAIFDRFTQVDGTETRENGGSGLGLTISRGLAELMGGTLDIATPSASGCFSTTMRLRLMSGQNTEIRNGDDKKNPSR